MMRLAWIGAGGALGSVMRAVLSVWIHGAVGGGRFPFGTLAVNVVGCLAIGLLSPWLRSDEARAFLVIGVLGGFTTFSAFGSETWELFHGPAPWLGGAYVAASVGLGLAAVALGRSLVAH